MGRIKKILFFYIFTILKLITASVLEDQKYWYTVSNDELKERLATKLNDGQAKNLVIFLGDGMSMSTVTATRIYAKGEKGHLSWEKFPFTGIVKTYNTEKIVPDSASTASAIFSGVKINHKTLGVDVSVKVNDCVASLDPKTHVEGIFSWAQDAGKSTGFVTTTRVVHATPAALYAHVPQRNWECEAKIPKEFRNKCSDIGRQLIEDNPGRYINVIMGGGRQCLVSNSSGTDKDPLDHWSCIRMDGLDLIEKWKEDKNKRGLPNVVVQNTDELRKVNFDKVEYLMGIFSNGHLPFDDIRDPSPKGQPSLKEMVESAVKVLRKNSNGFVLMVEGGMIDFAHHLNYARRALRETQRFHEAVEYVADQFGSDTLIVVTADHAHSLSILGYPDRGKGILGIAGNSLYDSVPYTTLAYATGYSVAQNLTKWENGSIHREDPTKLDITSYYYHQQTAVVLEEAYHDGTDVTVYARGPWAHLFTSTHEQSFIAHAMAYSLRIGPHSRRPLPTHSSATSIFHEPHSIILYFIIFIIVNIFYKK